MPEMGGSSQLLVHFCRGASAPGHSPRPLIGGFEENKSKTSDEARREIAKPCHPPKCRHPRKRVIQYSRGDRVQPSGRGVLDRRMRGDDERRVLDVLDPVIASAAKQSSFLSFSCGNGLLRGVYHRARIRATRWLAMTNVGRAHGFQSRSTIQAGAWSLAPCSPRSLRSTPPFVRRGATAGLSSR